MSRRGLSTAPLKAMIAALDLELLAVGRVGAASSARTLPLTASRPPGVRDAQLAAQPCVEAAAADQAHAPRCRGRPAACDGRTSRCRRAGPSGVGLPSGAGARASRDHAAHVVVEARRVGLADVDQAFVDRRSGRRAAGSSASSCSCGLAAGDDAAVDAAEQPEALGHRRCSRACGAAPSVAPPSASSLPSPARSRSARRAPLRLPARWRVRRRCTFDAFAAGCAPPARCRALARCTRARRSGRRIDALVRRLPPRRQPGGTHALQTPRLATCACSTPSSGVSACGQTPSAHGAQHLRTGHVAERRAGQRLREVPDAVVRADSARRRSVRPSGCGLPRARR